MERAEEFKEKYTAEEVASEWEKCQKRNFLVVQGEFGKIISVVRKKMCFLIAYNGKSYVQ
jgi:hypothetical protein